MRVGATDDFENRYMGRFREIAAPYGVFVEYALDRAGRDIGLHLTQPSVSGSGKIVTPALIWFQMKGIMRNTLPIDAYENSDESSVVLEVSHLRFWYMNIQPTYLAVYVECADIFLCIDIREWVKTNHGNDILIITQKTMTVAVNKKNILNDQFFRIALNRNLVPALRAHLSQEDDREISRFLRDSSVVKWLANSSESGAKARVRIISWITKTRTEVYFERIDDQGEWEGHRTHWQFMMGDIANAFPYLTLKPKRSAVAEQRVEIVDTEDGDEHHVTRVLRFLDDDENDENWWDEDDDVDGECLLPIGNDVFSVGEMAAYEYVQHEIAIGLNEVGERWAATLKVLEDAEVISVDMTPHLISVAPWHARDI